MKKHYIQPDSHVVVVKLMGSVLAGEDVPVMGSRFGTDELGSRQFENRFEDSDETWEVE
jgi:hypothetical protein